MTSAARKPGAATGPERLRVSKDQAGKPLRECVGDAMARYLAALDGHDVSNLHALLLKEVEPPLLEAVLLYTQGNQTQASKLLGINRGTLRKKLKLYELE